jgi:hypothetical protein
MPKILPGQTDLYALTDSRLSRGRPLEEVADKLLSSESTFCNIVKKDCQPAKCWKNAACCGK